MQNISHINQCFGIYLGKVVQHLSHGQLKVYIHGVYPAEWETKPDLLPICMQVTPQFAGSNNGNGVFSYPNIGSTVVCMFANGDQNLPLTIGSLLGGMNAFGQYEIIKRPDESISERHLITSGKSHIEMYENGKISAVVYDPIRTDAEVKYNNIPNAEVSTDVVIQRPICDKISKKELSNINCQYVLDNNINNGTISASTHLYIPLNKLSTTFLSDEQITITDTQKGDNTFDSYYITHNNGQLDECQTSVIHSLSTYNVTNIPKKVTEQTIQQLTSDSSIHRFHYIDGQNGCDMKSINNDSYSYTYASQELNILSNHTIKDKAESTITQTLPGDFIIMGKHDYKNVEMYTNSGTGDFKTYDVKSTLENTFQATKDASFTIETLRTNKSTKVDTLAQINPHQNKHDASTKAIFGADSGVCFNSSWKDDDLKNIAGSELQIKEQNTAVLDICINPKVYSNHNVHHKQTKNVNGTLVKRDIECYTLMSPTDGKFELKLTNNQNKQYGLISIDEDGNMIIDVSKSITIKSPTITVIGDTLTETFKSITTSSTTINIKGSSGDCKIKNVSLLNHVHQETQSGDIVSPQPTKSATSSN